MIGNGSESKVVSFSVQYLADGLMERAVAVERVKLSTSPLSSDILVPALQDLCSAIAGMYVCMYEKHYLFIARH